MKYQLELDFATCIMALALEGWSGLQAFGGNMQFVKSARSTLQMKDVDVGSVTHSQIDLADVSCWGTMDNTQD